TAKQAHARARHLGEQTVDALPVEFLLFESIVVDLAIGVVADSRLRTAAERITHEEIAYGCASDGVLQHLAGEVREKAAERMAAHVGESLDSVLGQKSEELVERMVAVADRQDREVGRSFVVAHHFWSMPSLSWPCDCESCASRMEAAMRVPIR